MDLPGSSELILGAAWKENQWRRWKDSESTSAVRLSNNDVDYICTSHSQDQVSWLRLWDRGGGSTFMGLTWGTDPLFLHPPLVCENRQSFLNMIHWIHGKTEEEYSLESSQKPRERMDEADGTSWACCLFFFCLCFVPRWRESKGGFKKHGHLICFWLLCWEMTPLRHKTK